MHERLVTRATLFTGSRARQRESPLSSAAAAGTAGRRATRGAPTYAAPQPEYSPQPTQTTVAQAPVDNDSYGDDDDDGNWVQPPPPTDTAPPPDYDDPAYDDDNAQVAGDTVPSVDVLCDQLDPYGTWYDDPTYGWVFTPQQTDYVPYSNGSWRYTDTGLLWVSNDPFGWATDHYGRWVWQNRWIWVPDTTW